jgi:hypothetical protein
MNSSTYFFHTILLSRRAFLKRYTHTIYLRNGFYYLGAIYFYYFLPMDMLNVHYFANSNSITIIILEDLCLFVHVKCACNNFI